MLIGLIEMSAKSLHSWGLSIKSYRWPSPRSQALSLFNLLTHTHLVRLKVHQAQHPASNDSLKWFPGDKHKDKVSKYSSLPAFNYLRLHLSRCVFNELSSLQWTFLLLESSFLLDSCKLWASAISCVEELYCLSLCLNKYFLLLTWNLLPLNLIWRPLLLSEGSCSPFQYQSRINKIVLHIPELF